MKHPPPIFFVVGLIIVGTYLAWSLITGSVRVRGIRELLSRQSNPREYWYHMRIFIVIFAVIAAIFAWIVL